jgi:2-dehydropantoate 2-reductase
MNFIVVGAGSIGCYVGGRLAAAGSSVWFVGRPRVTDALARAGLRVSDLEGYAAHIAAEQLHLAGTVAEAWKQARAVAGDAPTVLLLAVKGGATAAAAAEIGAACPAGTTVVSLQNGVENVARIQAAAPGLDVVAGMVPYNVVALQPSQVHRGTGGQLAFQDSAASRAFLPLFEAAGLPARLSADMASVQWGKLLLNLNNPVNALSGLPLREQLLDRDLRRVLAALQVEALGVLRRAGIMPAQVATVAPHVLPRILRLPSWIFRRVASRMLRMDAKARSSMWEDLQQGRMTEIDDLCGAVVRLAARHGGTAPLNEAMCRLVAGHQRGVALSGAAMRAALGRG